MKNMEEKIYNLYLNLREEENLGQSRISFETLKNRYENNQFLYIEKDDKIIACASLWETPSENYIEFDILWIDKNYRGKGFLNIIWDDLKIKKGDKKIVSFSKNLYLTKYFVKMKNSPVNLILNQKNIPNNLNEKMLTANFCGWCEDDIKNNNEYQRIMRYLGDKKYLLYAMIEL